MIQVTGLPADDGDCGWWHLSGPGNGYPRISDDLYCDYAVVGAGWTGLAAARRLADRQPDARIVVIDAGSVGYGAAGRNSGFLYDLPFVFSADAYRGREEDGREEISLYRTAIDEMRSVVHAGKVDCDWSEIGQYHVAADRQGERELAIIEAGLRDLGETFSTLGEGETRAALGTDYYRRAIHTPGTVQVNPLALLRAFASAMPQNVELYERSPVTEVTGGAQPRIVTAAGTITAKAVLLTTNAFLRSFSGLRPRLLPMMTFAGLTRPLGEGGMPTPAGESRWGVVPAALFGTSMRRLADGRILVRNTYAYSKDFQASRRLRARAIQRQLLSIRRRFPEVREPQLEWSWGGVVSIFRGANGCFGEVAPNIFAAVSSGMPTSILYGQQLAEYAVGGGGEALAFVLRRSQPKRLPPEPVVGLVAKAAAALRQRRAWNEI